MDPNPRNLEYIGEVSLVMGVRIGQPRRTSVYLKITHDNQLIIIFPDSSVQLITIPIRSILRMFPSTVFDNTIEFKWIDPANNSIVSNYIEFGSADERHGWLIRLLARRLALTDSNLSDLLDQQLGWVDSCRIDSMGSALLVGTETTAQIWVVLVHTLDTQVDKYFKKSVLFVHMDTDRPKFVEIDARKIVSLKLIIFKKSKTELNKK